ncbi:hypothetical protein N0V88_002559 [Collariella sp. IMI 366227]|nr:hypothetical protein N0V88_002559 [Collariella sp. IMI 366227]
MASAVKKTPATGRESPAGTPQRPSSRASTSSASGPAGAGLARTRSTRTSTPVSARVAAHQRRESMLNGTPNGKASPSPDIEREEAIRAETVAIIDDLKDRLAQAESSSGTYKRQADVLQSKLDDAHKEQAKLEEKVHESEEQIESLVNEKRETGRQMREMETIYEAERSAMMKEKDEMANREEEMQTVIQRLKDSLAQRNLDEDRPTRQSMNNSPSLETGSFAPPSSVQRSDSRNNSKLLLQKDKLIESLRLELAEAQIKVAEAQNQGGGRMQEVERQLMEARVANARLMEDNESYQLLLQDRTLKGGFDSNDFGYSSGASANQDALAALEGRGSGGTSLAEELSGASDIDQRNEQDTETQRRLEAELKSVKDQNKALTLYINKIIERLLQHQGFEHILDQTSDSKSGANTNKDLPPPPSSKTAPGPSLLQRAKTMAIGGTTTAPKTKPRPMSYMPSAIPTSTSAAISNPDTAPSIPIGLNRSASTATRRSPLSDQYTSVPGAASIVNAMYKGPNGGSGADGPLSPPPLFPDLLPPQGPGNRTSGGAISSGNFPACGPRQVAPAATPSRRDHRHGHHEHGHRRRRLEFPAALPPRSLHHHEKSMSTFGGNKPRPLRLVQETQDAAAAAAKEAANANKRQSWVGWAGSVFSAKKEDGSAGDVIRE